MNVLGAIALCDKSSLTGADFVQLVGQHVQLRPNRRIVEPQHNIASADPIAIPRDNFTNYPTNWVLYNLSIVFNLNSAGGNNGPRNARLYAPSS